MSLPRQHSNTPQPASCGLFRAYSPGGDQLTEHHEQSGASRDRADVRDVVLSQHQLHVLLDDAAHSGAKRALAEIGLENGHARQDIDDLRGLAGAVRQVRSTALNVVTKVATLAIIAALLAWAGAKVKVGQLLKPFGGQ